MARIADTTTGLELFDEVACAIARMSNVAFNLCTPNGKPSEKLTGWDIERVCETAKKAHQLSVLLGKMAGNVEIDEVKIVIEFNRIMH